ncbi:MAG TPA: N-acetylmuramoyl-L-alanine amidase [Prolixibacteraceae bacterium]|nr:N-acetylmuramoyl-L-alanine amidase [Prolixibacteraceae bacterium]
MTSFQGMKKHARLFFNRAFLIVTAAVFFGVGSAYAQTNYTTVTAEKGDGIYSLLRKNKIPLHYVDEFVRLNKDVLPASRELKAGQTYKLPLSSEKTPAPVEASPQVEQKNAESSVKYPIFGNEFGNVPIESNELSEAVYYLVSGHGGPDPGAIARYNGKTLCEDEYAYDITLRLARNLIMKGATVYMIIRDENDGIRNGWYLEPDKDEKCYPNLTIPINQNKRLIQRKDAVNLLYKKNKGKYQRLLIIHVDSRSKGEKIDVFFYHDSRSEGGKKLCQNLLGTFDEKYNKHQPGRGYHGSVSSRNLLVLKYSWPIASFIELGNINHERDLKRFIVEDNRQALANWLTEGLQKDFRNNKSL